MARATTDGNCIIIHTQWIEKDLVGQIPGAHHNGRSNWWEAPLTWAVWQQLRGVFAATLQVDELLAEWARAEYANRVAPARQLREQLACEGDTTWRPYQLADIAFIRAAGDCCIANEPGTGKTVTITTVARTYHFDESRSALPMLVIAPNSVKTHWEKHFAKWFPEATVYKVTGGAVGRRKILESAMGDPNATVIINIEAVRLHSRLEHYGSIRLLRCAECMPRNAVEADLVPTSRCEVHRKELNDIPFKTVVLDEAHRIKAPSAKQTRAVWQIMHESTVRHRWALTGTPIANHVGDLWSIMHGVCREEYPVKTKFVDRYALFTWDNGGNLAISDIRPDTRDELFAFLDPRFRRMLKAIVLPQLPPKVWAMREAPMIPKQEKAYREMEKQLYTRLEDGSLLLVTNNLTKNTRLLQFASSYAEIEKPDPEDPESWIVRLKEPSSKVDVLEEIIEENEGRSILVSAPSKQLINIAAERIMHPKDKKKRGQPVALITGDISPYERDIHLANFQAGLVKILMFTAAGGEGLDMTAADTLVRMQRSYSLLGNIQTIGRFDRIGAEHHECLNIIDIIAPGTVEEDQLERLREKEQRLESIVRDRAALARAGLSTHALDSEYAQLMASSLLPTAQEAS